MDEEPQIPRRYINIRRKGRKEWRTVKAQVWDQIPGRDGEAWLKEVRPVIQLDAGDRNVFKLIGKVHAALSDVGLRHRAQRFVNWAYYAGSYEEARRIAEEFAEFVEPE